MQGNTDGNEWYKDVNPEKLPDIYKRIAKEIGIYNTLCFAVKFQGLYAYFPKLDDILRSIRDEKIRQEFTGANYKELASKYRLTEVWIREIVSKKIIESDQVSIFDNKPNDSNKSFDSNESN